MKVLVIALLLAGCGMSSDGQVQPDAGSSGDASPCTLTISFDPPFPTADPIAPIRAQASLVGAPGVFTYAWTVDRNGPVDYTYEASDHSQIGFVAPTAGTYHVTVTVGGPLNGCPSFAEAYPNVGDPNGMTNVYRLRSVASPLLAPPQETIIQLQGNATEYKRDIALDPGLAVTGSVKNGTSGVTAYMKFIPVSAPYAFTETYSTMLGGYGVRLLGQNHNVLIIPTSTSLAPKLASWSPGVTDFSVGPGTLVTGVVTGPNSQGVSGAKIQLFAGGVPSTIGTADGSGNFSLRTDFSTSPITVKVTPPAGSGLPRLEATSAFDLAQQLTINYATTLSPCDVGGDAVQRSTTSQPNATVTFVGTTTGSVGTIGGVAATGTVHVTATANGSGVLPSTLVPRVALSAIVEVAANDYAVDSVDLSSCAAQTIDAAAPITRTGTTKLGTTALAGVRVEATPIGVLAQAGAQPVVATSDASGAFSIDLASGARYDVRFVDPQARAAQLAVPNIAPANLPTTAALPKAMAIFGKVVVTGVANPVVGASVQLLCATCTGVEASRPVAQTATDSASNYRTAVPDPGLN